jgi:hypothetical protein
MDKKKPHKAGFLAVIACFCAIAVITCLAGNVYADTTYTFYPIEDAWVNEANPAANYGNATYLSVKDRSDLAETYLKFSQADLDTIAAQPIKSASLFLYQYQGTNSPGDVINAHKVIDPWSESAINWDTKPAYDAQIYSSLEISGETNTVGWRQWSGLESTLSDWVKAGSQQGFALENNKDAKNEELYSRFYSSEFSNADLRPHLKVTAAPEPVSMLLFGIGGSLLSFVNKFKR